MSVEHALPVTSRPRTAALVRPWTVVTLVALLYVGVFLATHAMDPLSLAMLGTRFTEGDPEGTEGYDGQFAYQIAVNPTDAAPYLDVPAYRYQRILYPLLARLLALGQANLIPWTLILVNVVALAAGTRLTEMILESHGASPWYALAYGLYGGQLLALRLDLNEPLSQALVMLGILWGGRERWRLSAVAFALAILAKETALVFLGGYLLYLLVARKWNPLLQLGIVSLAPFVALQVILKAWLGQWGLGSGGAGSTAFEVIPFGGLWRIGAYSPKVLGVWLAILGPLLVVPIVLALVAAIKTLARGEVHPLAFLLLANALALVFLPFSTWREMLGMLRLSIGFVAAVLIFAAWRKSKRALAYSQLWMVTLVFLFKE